MTQREGMDLRLGGGSQPSHQALHDPSDEEGHQDRQCRRGGVESDGLEQGAVEPAIVDAARHHARDDDVSGPPQDPRAEHVEHRAGDCGQGHQHQDRPLGTHELHQPAHRVAEAGGALGGHAGRVPASGCPGVGGGQVRLRLVGPFLSLVDDGHAGLRWPICDSTISA